MDPHDAPIDPTPTSDPTPTTDHAPPSPPRRRSIGLGPVVALALVVAFSAGIGVGGVLVATGTTATATPGATPMASAPTEFGLIREAWDTIHQQYVARSELDERALIYGAIDGMTEAVGDTGHTDFMTPEERAQRNDSLSGSYVGIGVRIEPTDTGLPRIMGVFPDSPAQGAGLEVGDVIVAVDGRTTVDQTIDQVATWVRGEAGTTVTLTVRADGTGAERTMDIVRADVPIQAVSWVLVPGTTTALIRLEQFSSGAADEIVRALTDARSAGADRIVLDLRGNPGGYVNEAVGIASQFLASGVVYVERDAQGTETPNEVSPGGVATDLPLVVIVDGSTASSSEIVSGALQDAGRATIVGETTYGTGTVLGEFVLSDGSALRIGTVEWLTPSGRRIWHEGIAPDLPVTLADGTTPLLPDDVRALRPDQVTTMDDAPLARALELVARETVAVSP